MISRRSIDVGERFARQNLPSEPDKIITVPTIFRSVPSITPAKTVSIPVGEVIRKVQPPDYTPYSIGAPKPGLISQDGLTRRPTGMTYEMHKKLYGEWTPKDVSSQGSPGVTRKADYTDFPGGAGKQGLISQIGLTKRSADSAVIKTQGGTVNVGFLAMVDRFFLWLNRTLGG